MREHHVRRVAVVATLLSIAAWQAADAKVKLRVWHPWGGTTAKGMSDLGKLYEKRVPGVEIQMVSVPNQIETNEKFFASMAAGTPPEVILVDGTQVAQWASKGVLLALDKYVKSFKIRPEDFWTPSYKQCIWKGKMWSIPFENSPMAPWIYSKNVFTDSGLPGAPKSFEEFELYCKKIDRINSDGAYTRAGANPLEVPWWGNLLFHYGWAFGADFYDDAKDVYKLDSKEAIDSMDWLVSFYKKRGASFQRVAQTGLGGVVAGKVGMVPVLPSFASQFLPSLKNKAFDWGWGLFYGPVEAPSAWLGGWTMGIPANAKYQQEAFKFIEWVSHDPEGSLREWENVGWFPSTRKSLMYAQEQPAMIKPFVETLKLASHFRPASIGTPMVFGAMEIAGAAMMSGKKSAAQAMKEANAAVQVELARLLKRVRR